MKVLFFHATAGNPRAAPPLMGQAATTLRPFNQFLRQAIHTARDRQFRYALPWERVRNVVTYRLEPMDSLLRIPRRAPGMVITNWPESKSPDTSKRVFVENREILATVLSAIPAERGLVLHTEPPLLADDQIRWCGVECALIAETGAPPPQEVRDASGRVLNLLRTPTALDDRSWLLLLAGTHGDMDVLVDGEEVEAEALPPWDGVRRVSDSLGRSFEASGGSLKVEDPPADGPLRGDNGVRFRCEEAGSGGRKGLWVQLLPPEDAAADEFIDPRAAFCEDEVDQVWTAKFHRPDTSFKVKKVDRDRYQLLLDRLPPDDSTLYLPVDVRNLQLQQRALYQLTNAPLPHHQGLLRLCEDPQHARWPAVQPRWPTRWRSLTDATRSGTEQQRQFVAKAIATTDLAFLEGPPGSGKTTAICEIIQQLLEEGQRVLLCASTHVAIDNVLERLLGSESPVDAVRIGKIDKVDDKVQACQLDARAEALVREWRRTPGMKALGDEELAEMAERTIIMAANLTCGTTMGIVSHPLFRDRDRDMKNWERPITSMAHWDVLIVDEASKTLIQEFMVPALMAKRWMIVGDVRQLPPFADRADIVANLRDLVNDKDQPVFPRDHQRACLLRFRLLRAQLRQPGLRWLIVEQPGVLDWLAQEFAANPPSDALSVARVVSRAGRADGPVANVTLAQLKSGGPEALRVASADWVLVGDDVLGEASGLLPSNMLLARDLTSGARHLPEGDAFLLRQGWWLTRAGSLPTPFRDRKDEISTLAACQKFEQDWLGSHDLATELAWRLTRLHELRRSRKSREPDRLWADLKRLIPACTNIIPSLEEIQDIGLPSILEVLQEGIGAERTNRPSALTEGIPARRDDVFQSRFESLSFQHRMHDEIAEFPRDIFYEGGSLETANTIESRDKHLGWNFGDFRSRRAWADVRGREIASVNPDEVDAIRGALAHFIDWARQKGPPKRNEPKVWEAACLCFYVKQERALSQMLQELTGDDRKNRFMVRGAPVEIVCGTVDRFQGREADLVLLSMRNTGRVGFLDSPNRLNVAVTRARQQLVVVGNADYFGRCGITELQELVKRTQLVDEQEVRRWRRNRR